MKASLPVALALLALSCSSAPAPEAKRPAEARPAPAEQPSQAPSGPTIIAFGDSLTAGYGLGPGESYPARLRQELQRRGLDYNVVNEGVSGDTTAAALARVDLALAHPDAVLAIIAVGANDGLRGLPIDGMESNIRAIIKRFQDASVRVVLAGMRLPPNFGPDYVSAFEAVYPKLAHELDVPLMPFLLDGVAAHPELNQDDGIHPNEKGAVIVAKSVAEFIAPLLEKPAERAK